MPEKRRFQFVLFCLIIFWAHLILSVQSVVQEKTANGATTKPPQPIKNVGLKHASSTDKSLSRSRRSILVDSLGDVYDLDNDDDRQNNDVIDDEPDQRPIIIPEILPSFDELLSDRKPEPMKRVYVFGDETTDDEFINPTDYWDYASPYLRYRRKRTADRLEFGEFLNELENRIEQRRKEQEQLKQIDDYLKQAFLISKITAEMDEAGNAETSEDNNENEVDDNNDSDRDSDPEAEFEAAMRPSVVRKRPSLRRPGKHPIYYDLVDLNGIPGMFIPINQKASNFDNAED